MLYTFVRSYVPMSVQCVHMHVRMHVLIYVLLYVIHTYVCTYICLYVHTVHMYILACKLVHGVYVREEKH